MFAANQRFAISVGLRNGEALYDSRYVKLMAKVQTLKDDGERELQDIPLHDCKDEDLALFYEQDDSTKYFFNIFNKHFKSDLS